MMNESSQSKSRVSPTNMSTNKLSSVTQPSRRAVYKFSSYRPLVHPDGSQPGIQTDSKSLTKGQTDSNTRRYSHVPLGSRSSTPRLGKTNHGLFGAARKDNSEHETAKQSDTPVKLCRRLCRTRSTEELLDKYAPLPPPRVSSHHSALLAKLSCPQSVSHMGPGSPCEQHLDRSHQNTSPVSMFSIITPTVSRPTAEQPLSPSTNCIGTNDRSISSAAMNISPESSIRQVTDISLEKEYKPGTHLSPGSSLTRAGQISRDSRDLSDSGITKLAWVATRYPKSSLSKHRERSPTGSISSGSVHSTSTNCRLLYRVAQSQHNSSGSSSLNSKDIQFLNSVPLTDSVTTPEKNMSERPISPVADLVTSDLNPNYSSQLSSDSNNDQYLIPTEKENISRKSSSADSAIDLQGNFSSEEGQDSIDAIQPQDTKITIVSCDDRVTAAPSASDEAQPDGTKSPRMGFREAQTPSFTQINHLPSVIISDHSHDWGLDPADLTQSRSGHRLLIRKLSNSSVKSDHSESGRSYTSDSSYSLDEDEYDLTFRGSLQTRNKTQSSWRKIRNMVQWSPFIQQFKKHKYPWVQLAGHQGNFMAGDAGNILKKLCPKERRCLNILMQDILRPYVPEYKGDVDKDGDKYVQMQDLLCEFDSPSVMDCKIGTRTYLEEELEKARQNPKLRKDMYQKMVEIDPSEPTDEENQVKGITKPRYMIWRETISSTSNLGFRIEGIKKKENHRNNFKRTKTSEDVAQELRDFTDGNLEIIHKYIRRLKAVRATLESSTFFRSHEVVGSSLLFIHDHTGQANTWLIDFGKTTPLPQGKTLDHRTQWAEGNQEDGYLFGLDNMLSIFTDLSREIEAQGTSEQILTGEANSNW